MAQMNLSHQQAEAAMQTEATADGAVETTHAMDSSYRHPASSFSSNHYPEGPLPPSGLASSSLHASSALNISSGAARITDLHPSEKSKIGKLLQEIVALKREGERKEQAQRALEAQMEEQRRRNEAQEQEKETIRREFEITQAQLRMYEARTSASASIPPSTLTKLKPAASESATRLHELSERARAAATGSPYTRPMNAASSPYTAPQSGVGAAPAASSSRPFSSILSSLTSSPYRAPLPLPASSGLSAPQGYSTDDERPRSTVPQPSLSSSLRSSPARLMEPVYHPYQPPVPQTALYEIKQVLQEAREHERQASMSPTRRQLHLPESGTNTATDEDDHDSLPDRLLFASSTRRRNASRSPTAGARDLPVVHSSVIHGTRQPTKVDFLPPAVSGVTRVLAAVPSPDHRKLAESQRSQQQPPRQDRDRTQQQQEQTLEQRALELAREMYEKKLEDDRRASASAAHERDSAPSKPAARPTSSGSSLSSYFHAHPLTSQLSPMQSLRRHRHARAAGRSASPSPSPTRTAQSTTVEEKPHQPRSGRKKQRTPPKQKEDEYEEERKDYSQPPVASGIAATMLTKSLQIANDYASQRRARSASQTATSAAPINESGSQRTSDPLAQSIRVPDSPYSLTSSTAMDPIAMTPTTRKIHRLLSIQNPTLAKEQRERQQHQQQMMKEREEKLERVERKREEMQEQRRRELEQAEARAKQAADRMAQSLAATKAAAEAAKEHSHAAARHLAAPAMPQPRPKTPVETYVPPPFSYRNPSRTSQRPEEQAAQQYDSPSAATATAGSHASHSRHSYLDTPGSVVESHPNTHTSFLSPFPTRRSHSSSSVPNTGGTVTSEHPAEDAEIMEMFQLRSPGSLQHQQMAVEEEMEQEMHRGRGGGSRRSGEPSAYAHNFAADMLTASGLPSSPHDRPAYVGSGVAPFHYSAAYPPSRSAAGHAAVGVASASADHPRASSAERARARLQSKIETLHMMQLERDLEEVMPQVMQGLANSRVGTPAQQSAHDTPKQQQQQQPPHQSQAPVIMEQASISRLSQPSSPIVRLTRQQRDDRYPMLTQTQDGGKHSASPAKKPTSRYAAHVQAYSERRSSGAPVAAAHRANVPSSAVHSMPTSDTDEFGECLDIIEMM